jgi:hypothetical protein
VSFRAGDTVWNGVLRRLEDVLRSGIAILDPSFPAHSGADKGTTHGVEVVLDFMFWRHRKTGWYLEPSWSRSAGSGEQTIGVTGGFLFGWH